MTHLFTPLKMRGIEIRNRIGVSPMCQYSANDGLADDWHLVHLGSRAVGGAGLVIAEATAVTPEGRISTGDLGIWTDKHAEALAPVTRFIKKHGAVAGIQIAHAGRKASRDVPWKGGSAVSQNQGGWQVIGASALPFADGWQTPREMTVADIKDSIETFVMAARRAANVGFQLLEIHAAHGYLLNSFLSPLANKRTDTYGGNFEGRTKFLLEVVRATRNVWPETLPMSVRLSCSDWIEGGWNTADTVALSLILKKEGVDLIDCSSGGMVPDVKIPVGANYQVGFAAEVKRQAHIATAAVGMITQPMQADAIVRTEQADLVFLARELLRDPYWPLHAAEAVHQASKAPVPPQYQRAFPAPRLK